jgi:hypothetical protein
MSTASLVKFTVPLQTGQSASAQGLLMPKLKYRFRTTFLNFGISQPTTELTKQVMDIQRPNVDFDPVVLDVYNSKIKLAGKPTWQDTQVNLRDDATGAVAKLVGEQIQKQFDFLEQSSAASGIDYKFQMNYEVLDGGNGVNVPTVLETWEMYGCWIKAVNYNDMNYTDSGPVTITLSISFDNALQTPIGNGIGAVVGRTLGTVTTG